MTLSAKDAAHNDAVRREARANPKRLTFRQQFSAWEREQIRKQMSGNAEVVRQDTLQSDRNQQPTGAERQRILAHDALLSDRSPSSNGRSSNIPQRSDPYQPSNGATPMLLNDRSPTANNGKNPAVDGWFRLARNNGNPDRAKSSGFVHANGERVTASNKDRRRFSEPVKPFLLPSDGPKRDRAADTPKRGHTADTAPPPPRSTTATPDNSRGESWARSAGVQKSGSDQERTKGRSR